MGASRLLIVGGGRMGEALIAGLTGATDFTLEVVEHDDARRAELTERYPAVSVVQAIRADSQPSGLGGAVVAVKPGDVEGVCRSLSAAGVPRVLSIAAGVTLRRLEAGLPGVAVIRAMPNTPALVGAGASAISAGKGADVEDVAWARSILEAVGIVVELPEKSLDAVTGLSGSGPAYVFLLCESLIDAGVLVGLSRSVAKELAVQTLLGSARLLSETGDEPSALRAAVTSPGGTTSAGLRALEAGGLRHSVLEAVAAATERSRQLGSP